MMNTSIQGLKLELNSIEHKGKGSRIQNYSSSCAAAGQFGLMSVYNKMFDQVDLSASQLLLTQQDFQDDKRLRNLRECVDNLLALGIVPIINENDAVSGNMGYTSEVRELLQQKS